MYPPPKRGKHQPVLENLDPDVQHLKRAEGDLEVEFSKERLIKYLTTQSNIEQAVQQGKSYQQVEEDLMQQLSAQRYKEAFTKGHFLYGYHYDIYTLVGD